MSRLRKFGQADLPFGIYVPSAILKNGSLIVSWATGQKATSQIDYGFDASVPNTTAVALLEPGDEGYIEGEDTPKMERYHEVPFPGTAVDSTHFFRVRSSNKAGKTLESDVFSVYLTEKIVLKSKNIETAITLNIVSIDHTLSVIGSGKMLTNPTAQLPQSTADNVATEAKATIQPIDKQVGTPNQKTTMKTNYTLTVV